MPSSSTPIFHLMAAYDCLHISSFHEFFDIFYFFGLVFLLYTFFWFCMCKKSGETLGHLLLHCDVAKE